VVAKTYQAMNTQLTDSAAYTSLAGALDKVFNLEPLVNSIEGVLNDYRPAAYAIAFILLVVGTMREFLYPETRRFLQAVLRAVLLVATIGFAASFIDWGEQAARALAQLPGAQQVSFGNLSYSMKPGDAYDNSIGAGFTDKDCRNRLRQRQFGQGAREYAECSAIFREPARLR
jgi:hypothetical protein